MHEDLQKSPMVQAVLLANKRPREGLPTLARMIHRAWHEGRSEDAHVLGDNFTGAALRAKQMLATAERIARRLASTLPDRYHLSRLAEILDARNKADEAADVRAQALKLPDLH